MDWALVVVVCVVQVLLAGLVVFAVAALSRSLAATQQDKLVDAERHAEERGALVRAVIARHAGEAAHLEHVAQQPGMAAEHTRFARSLDPRIDEADLTDPVTGEPIRLAGMG